MKFECSAKSSVSTGFTGAIFKTATNPRIAICSSTNTKGDGVAFSADHAGWTGTAGVLVTDLNIGTYRVFKDHSADIPGYSSVIVDSTGTLYFEDLTLGHYEILLNASSSADITTFAIPGQKKLTIYPNPSDRFCNILIACDADEFYTIRIHDAQGRLIHQSDQYQGPNTLSIPMNHLNPGEYYVNRTNKAKVLDSEKFILL